MKMPEPTRATTENGIAIMNRMLEFNPRPTWPPTAPAHPGQA
jgi:hypothetical protein